MYVISLYSYFYYPTSKTANIIKTATITNI